MIHTVKGFGIVNKTKVDDFLELSCFFDYPANIGNLISGSSAFSKSSLNIWKFMVHVLLKPGLENFEHHFTSVWDECNCAVVWAFFGITTKDCIVKAMVFPLVMYAWESWIIKKAEHRRTDAFELLFWRRLLRVYWTARWSNQSVLGNQSWIFIRKTDVETEAPILWPPAARSWLIVINLDAGNDWRHEEKGTAEDEIIGWHHWFNGHEFEKTPGNAEE